LKGRCENLFPEGRMTALRKRVFNRSGPAPQGEGQPDGPLAEAVENCKAGRGESLPQES
jgi:hypothetical protein